VVAAGEVGAVFAKGLGVTLATGSGLALVTGEGASCAIGDGAAALDKGGEPQATNKLMTHNIPMNLKMNRIL
jgi:hypothetical protein